VAGVAGSGSGWSGRTAPPRRCRASSTQASAIGRLFGPGVGPRRRRWRWWRSRRRLCPQWSPTRPAPMARRVMMALMALVVMRVARGRRP
jgi:hypothetical protein